MRTQQMDPARCRRLRQTGCGSVHVCISRPMLVEREDVSGEARVLYWCVCFTIATHDVVSSKLHMRTEAVRTVGCCTRSSRSASVFPGFESIGVKKRERFLTIRIVGTFAFYLAFSEVLVCSADGWSAVCSSNHLYTQLAWGSSLPNSAMFQRTYEKHSKGHLNTR